MFACKIFLPKLYSLFISSYPVSCYYLLLSTCLFHSPYVTHYGFFRFAASNLVQTDKADLIDFCVKLEWVAMNEDLGFP